MFCLPENGYKFIHDSRLSLIIEIVFSLVVVMELAQRLMPLLLASGLLRRELFS